MEKGVPAGAPPITGPTSICDLIPKAKNTCSSRKCQNSASVQKPDQALLKRMVIRLFDHNDMGPPVDHLNRRALRQKRACFADPFIIQIRVIPTADDQRWVFQPGQVDQRHILRYANVPSSSIRAALCVIMPAVGAVNLYHVWICDLGIKRSVFASLIHGRYVQTVTFRKPFRILFPLQPIRR